MKQPVGCFRDAEKEKALAEAEGHLMYRVAWLHTHDHQHMSRPAAAGCSWVLPFWDGAEGPPHLDSMRELDAA